MIELKKQMAKISPSAILTFKQCPLKFRLRFIDLIVEKMPSIEAAKGTVVHRILEKMFKQPAENRIIKKYESTVINAILELQKETNWTGNSKLNYPFKDNEQKSQFINDIISILKTYFQIENPSVINIKSTEQFLQLRLKENLNLNGFADRLDNTKNGIEIIDYKTGKKPSIKFQDSVIFQMTSYALILYSNTGQMPSKIKAMFLNPTENGILEQEPNIKNVLKIEKEYLSCWDNINERIKNNKWNAIKSKLCDWCDLQEFCPEFNGKIPDLPNEKIQKYLK
jgi:putative RecB family exonuclease